MRDYYYLKISLIVSFFDKIQIRSFMALVLKTILFPIFLAVKKGLSTQS